MNEKSQKKLGENFFSLSFGIIYIACVKNVLLVSYAKELIVYFFLDNPDRSIFP